MSDARDPDVTHPPDASVAAGRLPSGHRAWLTRGVTGIGLASLLSDLGHEIPTSLLPTFLSTVLGAPAAALGLIEGVADALSGAAKFVGGGLADDPARRRTVAVGGYTLTAVLSAAVGLTTAAWQVALLRAGAWTARGIRTPSRNALLADAVDPAAYGRAYGFERAMDNAGAVVGPLLAIGLVAAIGIRPAIVVSVVPGLLAAVAIVFAIRHLERPLPRQAAPVRFVARPLLRGRLGRLLAAVTLFEAANVAATLLILRTTELMTPSLGETAAAATGIALYTGYNFAATLASVPAGRLVDVRSPKTVLALGFGLFALAYGGFAWAGPSVLLLGAAFVAAGIGIGSVETAENAAVAALSPAEHRGSAFGLLAVIQSLGDLVASAGLGLVWTLAGAEIAFGVAAIGMTGSLVVLLFGVKSEKGRSV